MNAFRFFQKGILPFEGSLLEQPAKVLEAFNLIDALEVEYKSKEEARQKKKGK